MNEWWKHLDDDAEPAKLDPKMLDAALRKMKEEKSGGPPPFVGISGVGCVCYSEYRDIVDRTGPYCKGGPLDLGDEWYAKKEKP